MGRDFLVSPLVSQVYLFHRRGLVWLQSCNNLLYMLCDDKGIIRWVCMHVMACCPRTLNSTVTMHHFHGHPVSCYGDCLYV